jgi:twitching motility protein PilJ
MEKSTQGVVEGARLSDAAGAALVEIERVSHRLAELIEGMALATGAQAASASGVAGDIGHILQVTEQAKEGTQQTAQAVRQLSALAQQLKDSVSRFRITNENQ